MVVNTLSLRWQGKKDVERRGAPFLQSGRLVELREGEEGEGDLFVMRVGKEEIEFFIKDFAELFETYERARMIFSDAVYHQDFVEIRALSDRLAYVNDAQYVRLQKLCENSVDSDMLPG